MTMPGLSLVWIMITFIQTSQTSLCKLIFTGGEAYESTGGNLYSQQGVGRRSTAHSLFMAIWLPPHTLAAAAAEAETVDFAALRS